VPQWLVIGWAACVAAPATATAASTARGGGGGDGLEKAKAPEEDIELKEILSAMFSWDGIGLQGLRGNHIFKIKSCAY
jgi:hypothetical protein